MEDIIEKNKKINIFFCLNEEQNFITELKEIIKSEETKINYKGLFNKSEILDEISYYLGIEDEKRGEIDRREIENIIILYDTYNNITQLLFDFINKFEKSIALNDDHPFFIILPYEKEEIKISKSKLIKDINEFQKNKNNKRKLDSRNIFFEEKNTILERIKKIYNYFNEKDEEAIYFVNTYYDMSNTINILTIGKRGSGKSTLINKILGEKKAYAHKNAKTLKTKEYYHKYYPLKFVDSAGFEIGEKTQIENVSEFLEKNNLNYINIYKKIHFIFYLFKNDDKFENIEFKIIKQLSTYNIDILFIVTYMKEDDKQPFIYNLKEALKKNSFTKEEINKIMSNIFCLDLLDKNNSSIISDILSSLNKKLKKYKESSELIQEYIDYFYNIGNNNKDDLMTMPDEEIKDVINNSIMGTEEQGILTNKTPPSLDELIKLIKRTIKDNIFYIDLKNDRNKKKKLAQKILHSFEMPSFWWGAIPIPLLDKYLAKKSREKMIFKITKIYDIVVEKRKEEKTIKEYKPKENHLGRFIVNSLSDIITVGGIMNALSIGLESIFLPLGITIGVATFYVRGKISQIEAEKIGEKIIDEFDKEYAKINILDKYYDIAEKLNNNFKLIENFPYIFKDNWYDIDIHKNI